MQSGCGQADKLEIDQVKRRHKDEDGIDHGFEILMEFGLEINALVRRARAHWSADNLVI